MRRHSIDFLEKLLLINMTDTKLKIGTKEDGSPKILRIDNLIRPELDKVKKRVIKQGYQYICVVTGLPGSGKSTLSRTLARYCCKWFNEDYIAFTGDEFVQISNDCPEFSAVILDESFESLNSKVGMSEEFLKILNHLQIIRQKHLFIFLCLPNFFDLSKNVALFLTSHLFLTYSDENGDRGRFLVFDREAKKKLYILGRQFQNYNAEKANFRALFWENEDIVNIEKYNAMKKRHLLSQNDRLKNKKSQKWDRDLLLWRLYKEKGWKITDIANFISSNERTVYKLFEKHRQNSEKGATCS